MAMETVIGPGVRSVSPPNSGQPNSTASARRPCANPSSHCSPISRGRASDSRKPSGRAPFAARSDKFTRSALRATVCSGILGKKMHAADDGVGLEHQIAARRRREKGGIVGQAERAGMGRERLEETRDQAVFGRHVVVRRPSCHPAARPNSPARTRRASWSSTALTMPVSSRSTKAAATSAYSDTTTRAGTSRGGSARRRRRAAPRATPPRCA